MKPWIKACKECSQKGSLTVEAALVMPIFLYFMIAFLYFIQIFTIQEQIQSSITQMGLNLSKAAYFCKDFPEINELLNFDESIFEGELDIGLNNLVDSISSGSMLKLYAMKYLDTERINESCIKGGFDGLSFYQSSILNDQEHIDIVVTYKLRLPLRIFKLGDMSMLQRIRLRGWTGYELEAVYKKKASEDSKDESIVYITDTGSVYHTDKNCSHIALSVTSVQGLPTELRNNSGGKYYSCESCCDGKEGALATYYITEDGSRYHSKRDCSSIKRSVKEVSLSEVSDKPLCKRCGK